MRLSNERPSLQNFSERIEEGDFKSPSSNIQPCRFDGNRLVILDQTQLPVRLSYRNLKNYKAVAKAIKTLQVRGAPLIGVIAACGLALEAKKRVAKKNFRSYLTQVAKVLKKTRPTAVNLFWAIERIEKIIEQPLPNQKLSKLLMLEAQKIWDEEKKRSLAMGKVGAKLVKKNAHILTICNSGKLAAPGLGTALSVIYTAAINKKNPLVYVCETRPLLQGARLTAFELTRAGIAFVLITDSMVGTIASRIDLVLVGADRIAANGDVANKIGTLTLAITANHYQLPFYVVAPISTFDLTKPNGNAITIEMRGSDEISKIGGQRIAPKGVRVYNPAFDITPAKMITGIITDKGIIYPPYQKSIAKFCQ